MDRKRLNLKLLPILSSYGPLLRTLKILADAIGPGVGNELVLGIPLPRKPCDGLFGSCFPC